MLTTLEETINLINQNKTILIAGDEKLLDQLPAGNWVAGTIPYFMDETGGKVTKDLLFVSVLPDISEVTQIKSYSASSIPTITQDTNENGFTFIIIPAKSDVHIRYAEDAPNFEGLFLSPILGWISGVHLDDLNHVTPKVYSGIDKQSYSDKAVAIHIALPENKSARIGIINVFKQGTGDVIKFQTKGFEVSRCLVNGKEDNFAEYIKRKNINTQLPLVADYNGVNINVSIQELKDSSVSFYAPVFEEVEYKLAAEVEDYVSHFQSALPPDITAVFSCNCILNYLYSELEGKKTKGMYGPVTFGEVAYQLLNQTLVYLEIEDL